MSAEGQSEGTEKPGVKPLEWIANNKDVAVRFTRNITILLFLSGLCFSGGAVYGAKATYDMIVDDGREVSSWLTSTGIRLRAASAKYPHMEYQINVIDEDVDDALVEKIIEENLPLAQKVLATNKKKKKNG